MGGTGAGVRGAKGYPCPPPPVYCYENMYITMYKYMQICRNVCKDVYIDVHIDVYRDVYKCIYQYMNVCHRWF